MEFMELLEKNRKMFESWKATKEYTERYSPEELQKEFIECIVMHLELNLVIQTPEERDADRMSFHCSMEGLDY